MKLLEALPWLRSPMLVAGSQAMLVALMANTIAQMIRVIQTRVWTFSFPQIIRFFLLNTILLPMNYCWALYLEQKFPSYYEIPLERPEMSIKKDRRKSGASWELLPSYEEALECDDASTPLLSPTRTPRSSSPVRPRQRLHLGNTIAKLLLDSFTVGAFCNLTITLSVLGFLKGYTGYEILMDIEHLTVPIMLASYLIYPPAAVFAYILVPVEKRIVYFQFVGLIWGIYISLAVGV